MTSPDNMDWSGLLARVFGTRKSDSEILQLLEAVDEEIQRVVAAAMAVYGELGHGYVVGVYRDALAIECDERSVPYRRNVPVLVKYKGHDLHTGYAADLVCCGDILVLVKSTDALSRVDDMELINHLKATGYRRGLTLNFGLERLEFRRIVGPANAG